MKDLSPHPSCHIQTVRVPGTEERVYIIDNFVANPDGLREYAHNTAYLSSSTDGTLYPGKRDDMPRPYYELLRQFLQSEPLRRNIAFGNQSIEIYRCLLSLTTTPPHQLMPPQRIPHVDSTDDGDFASVHYLCGSEHGGTGFFRFKPSDQTQVKPGEEGVFRQMLERSVELSGEHCGYLSNSTELFDRVAYVEARYNRLVVYKSNLLHSAVIIDPISYQNNLSRGRLSIASFFYVN